MEQRTPVYWEHELETRDSLIEYFTRNLRLELTRMNSAFRFVRIETPILVQDALRSDMTMPAYNACVTLMNGFSAGKFRLPLVVWQYGKIFDDNSELCSLQYNVLYSKTTGMPYLPVILQTISMMLGKHCGGHRIFGILVILNG